jgi:hypothetical protein
VAWRRRRSTTFLLFIAANEIMVQGMKSVAIANYMRHGNYHGEHGRRICATVTVKRG